MTVGDNILNFYALHAHIWPRTRCHKLWPSSVRFVSDALNLDPKTCLKSLKSTTVTNLSMTRTSFVPQTPNTAHEPKLPNITPSRGHKHRPPGYLGEIEEAASDSITLCTLHNNMCCTPYNIVYSSRGPQAPPARLFDQCEGQIVHLRMRSRGLKPAPHIVGVLIGRYGL
jgi:hypothetical protein